MDQEELTQLLSKVARTRIPNGTTIAEKALTKVLKVHNFSGRNSWLKRNFSMLVEEVQLEAFRLYLNSQAPAADFAFREVLGPLLPSKPTKDQFFQLLQDNFQAVDRFFLALSQGRKARAGGTMEFVIEEVISRLGYPFTPQAKIDGQPDFLFPSFEHFQKMAMDCIIFTVKRTLRERWRQIVTEGSKGLQFFLATIDENVATKELAIMKNHRVWMVVPKDIKANCYPEIPNVLSFEEFLAQHLDPAMTRWKKNGVI